MDQGLVNKLSSAIFGGGCFWCTEAVFQNIKGVENVVSGYAGGKIKNPTYEQVSMGGSGHAEVVKLEFNPAVISYQDLLNVFFAVHDPTTLNRQGADEGEQYRSVIFYTSEEQKEQSEKFIKENQKEFNSPIVTQVLPLESFYTAEQYHQNYYRQNQSKPYCQLVIGPKLQKFKEKFKHLIKE